MAQYENRWRDEGRRDEGWRGEGRDWRDDDREPNRHRDWGEAPRRAGQYDPDEAGRHESLYRPQSHLHQDEQGRRYRDTGYGGRVGNESGGYGRDFDYGRGDQRDDSSREMERMYGRGFGGGRDIARGGYGAGYGGRSGSSGYGGYAGAGTAGTEGNYAGRDVGGGEYRDRDYGVRPYGQDDRGGAFAGHGGYEGGYQGGYQGNYGGRGDDRYRGRSRGFWEQAGDEIASWFGDDDAERRRHEDERRAAQHRGRGPRGYSRSDDRVREDVSDRLTDDAYIDASEIEVTVSGGEVTLTGMVPDRRTKRRAEDVAESVSGVSHVQNNLRIRAQAAGQGATGWGSSTGAGASAMAGAGGTTGGLGAGTGANTGSSAPSATGTGAGTSGGPAAASAGTGSMTGSTTGETGSTGTGRSPTTRS
ncbi:hypothetical protein AZL_017670 [Azospirillum sp. B510]|uniref:BON domain-containing protein n=1 Tax=Azospirillum sp. (strain B510) TaxID=137722 RepID=UPI0001C4C0F5|nr:BON domain-containing protein [Azospirillum sp. B510]BAI72405.1 hypothetical protein AZL_017670 [Azospirillum sp. B510]